MTEKTTNALRKIAGIYDWLGKNWQKFGLPGAGISPEHRAQIQRNLDWQRKLGNPKGWSNEADRQRAWVRYYGNYNVPGVEGYMTQQESAQQIADEKEKEKPIDQRKDPYGIVERDRQYWSKFHNPDGSEKLPRYVYPRH